MTKNKVSILNLNEGPIKTKTIGKNFSCYYR